MFTAIKPLCPEGPSHILILLYPSRSQIAPYADVGSAICDRGHYICQIEVVFPIRAILGLFPTAGNRVMFVIEVTDKMLEEAWRFPLQLPNAMAQTHFIYPGITPRIEKDLIDRRMLFSSLR
jgi:hypothetical protein